MPTETHSHSLSIHDLPAGERPRERLLLNGAKTLSNAELLAIILRTGTAKDNVIHLAERVLAACDGLHGLMQISPAELEAIPGLGAAKISEILALIELAQRLSAQPADANPIITSAEDAAQMVMDMRYLAQEQVRVMLLDHGRRVIHISTIYIGTLNASVVRVAEIFREAISRNSAAIILVHNHPAGDAQPSPEDIELTRALIAAGQLLDIQFLDHLIIGSSGWVSLKTLRLGFQ